MATNKYFVGALLWAVFILVLTLTPGKSIPDLTLLSYDKLGHAFVFMILSFLISKGFQELRRKALISTVTTLVITTFYGFLIEFSQDYIPDRNMDWFDAIANIIGSILGVLVFYLSIRIKRS
ncbi:MAG: VanZ family protein [Fulvivirga sp.]|nr:VanZ family protein [Fulvivirga sp.]